MNTWDFCTNAAMRRAVRQLSQLYDEALDPTGLRVTQFTLLSQIRRDGAPALSALADEMVMDLSALGRSVQPLVREGLVELVPDADDRRVKRARLTEHGLAVQAEAAQRWKAAQTEVDAILGPDNSRALRDTLTLVASDTFAERFLAGIGATERAAISRDSSAG